ESVDLAQSVDRLLRNLLPVPWDRGDIIFPERNRRQRKLSGHAIEQLVIALRHTDDRTTLQSILRIVEMGGCELTGRRIEKNVLPGNIGVLVDAPELSGVVQCVRSTFLHGHSGGNLFAVVEFGPAFGEVVGRKNAGN